ncbi:nuclear transport factor 2 family protein [Crocinitomix catalasitica]|uniref:nuclear transport factor 2 family protein n=1 Tax=Crocinitomix catalasitica TaxID=184607 RepID=UPI000487A323|nr:nuclear transport factor 2 family protein [Crocinitomix catalasitica]
MKYSKIIALVFTVFLSIGANAQNGDMQKVEATIKAFVLAGDKNKADEIGNYLDDNYRIVMNRLFGSESVSTMDKATYVEKIRSKEYGGDTRKITILNLSSNGNSVSATVKLVGEKMTATSIFILLQDAKGNWKIVSDTVMIE